MKALKKTSQGAKKQGGFVMTSELILLSTTLVVGLVVGLATMRDSVTAEMEDLAEAIGSLDQGYVLDGLQNAEGTAAIDGSGFDDAVDLNAGDQATFLFIDSDFSEASPFAPAVPVNNGAGPTAAGSLGLKP